MDFMRLLKSLEELLYELVSWLVFYPLTFWRALTRPLSMMEYADIELSDRPEDQYDDTVSPPLFLLITLLLSQALSAAFPTPLGASAADIEALTRSTSNLLIARGVIFGIFPMAMAVTLIKLKRMALTRSTLRPPFFSQLVHAGSGPWARQGLRALPARLRARDDSIACHRLCAGDAAAAVERLKAQRSVMAP